MENITFKVTGMSCMGCVNSVRALLSALPGTGKIDIDLASGRVSVEADPALTNENAIRQAIEDGGYGLA